MLTEIESMDNSVLKYYKTRNLDALHHTIREKGSNLISIVITTYNRNELLKRAIDSILLQTYENIEIIVIDDNSSDGTGALLQKYEQEASVPFSFVINSKNQGPSLNRKKGLKLSKGNYIIFMDDDDFYCNIRAFSRAMDFFNQYKNLAFVSGNAFLEKEKDNELTYKEMNVEGHLNSKEYFDNLMVGWDKPKSTFSTIFSKQSLYESEAHKMEMFNDSTIYLRSLLAGDAYIDKDIWGVYFIHSNNISSSIDCKFIVENLEEKYIMSKPLIEKNELTDEWLVKHFTSTIKYFFSGNNINNLNLLVAWIDKLDSKQTRTKMKKMLYIELAKSSIKKIIRR